MSAQPNNKISNGGADSRCLLGFSPEKITKLFYCVAPAEIVDVKNRLKSDDVDCIFRYSSLTDLGYYIAFPHVDSCIGVVCHLADKTVIAAHLNSYDIKTKEMDAVEVFKNFMAEHIKQSTVLSAVIFGNVDGWFPLNSGARVGLPNWINLQIHDGSPLDAVLDVFCGRLIIFKWTKDRDFRVPSRDIFIEISAYS